MDMSNIAKWIPVPYFQIRQDGTILNSSNITHSYFQSTSSIWNIIYKEDRNKAILMLSQITNSYPVTQYLILQTSNKLFMNFKCTIQWQDSIGHLVCTEAKNIKVPSVLSVQKSLVNTQKRLEESEKHLNNVIKILDIRKH
ncbi:hypothetical protein ABET11_21470 [Priestia megaterium]|jgi:hypothetical protein|uniref:Uncharacterized protein n=2 Tax=Priestia megaterium TaxID=1404 RepID=A0AAE5UA05_PRIMG|nr:MULTISPECIES: hypothetical protein [Priestia]KOP69476.1 hypothetical protein AMS61_28865 [Bacillus sp. FJAT-21351]KQU18757.1 hypothetical protein ASG61_27765 [Bacillus sp. Leaf75]MCJ7983054.1 hypothetical protein [Priestia sp. OVL9]MDH6657091.1 hypothetical protein [Bacillus sp. PvP124]MDP9579499.1 hypothetical protein [Bacillus sp. 1751]RFB19883.1 hypothetical protein DZB87_28005 [Bacillus sp. ALD]RFB34165.1 hypothetical protein DZB86_24990 [Bacillus sp. RC]